MSKLPDDATGKALQRIQKNGPDLSKPMDVDFFVAIPTRNDGERFATQIRELGFKTSVEQDEETGNWTCYCSKQIIPKYDVVISIECQLMDLAKHFEGYVDGFGSYGNGQN